MAVFIFTASMTIFFFYVLNDSSEGGENLEKLYYEGAHITNLILSEGYPTNWNSENVVEIGILTNEKINETKLERFYNLTQEEYSKTRIKFNTKYDYYFFLDRNMTINSKTIEGIGKPGIKKSNIDAENLIKISRATIYKNKPVAAELYIWKE